VIATTNSADSQGQAIRELLDKSSFVGSEVCTAMRFYIVVFWFVAPCILWLYIDVSEEQNTTI
jgi:hypothetical protein